MNGYLWLADFIALVHLIYVSVVVLGQLAIMIGWPLGWKWIRNPWFRIVHLAMILFVAAEAVVQFECPLTTWELEYRRLAEPEATGALESSEVRDRTFTGRLVRKLVYWQMDCGQVLDYSYYVFAGLVLATIFLVPPRFRRRRASVSASAPTTEPVPNVADITALAAAREDASS